MKKFLFFFFGLSALLSIFAYVFFMDAYTKLVVGSFEMMVNRHPLVSIFFGSFFAVTSTMMLYVSWLRIIETWNPCYLLPSISGLVIVTANICFLTKLFDIYNIHHGFSSNYVSSCILPLLLHIFMMTVWGSVITNKKEEPEKETEMA